MGKNASLARNLVAAKAALAANRGAGDRAAPPREARGAPEDVLDIATPTDEQRGRGHFDLLDVTDKRNGGASITIGKAYRRRPMIETLGDQGIFSDAVLDALRHYRYHADIADRSIVRDSLNKQRGGSGMGDSIEYLNAVRVRNDCERAAGSLVDILRAVVVYDQSLSQWAITHGGSVEKTRQRKGRPVTTIEPRPNALAIARLDIKMAAKRVEAELRA